MAQSEPTLCFPPAGHSDNETGRAFRPAFAFKTASLRRSHDDGTLFFSVAVIAVWLISRPFRGIEGDSRIYMARALADLHLATIGRDMMFVYDGQSQFSIFSIVTGKLAGFFGLSTTCLILTLVALAAWLVAANLFVGRFAEGRWKLSILMIVAVAPSSYSPFELLHFGESLAVPRPFAEAGVLAGLAFLVDRRRVAAAAFFVLAAAFHPIMALPGLMVFCVDLCFANRKWLVVGSLVATLAVIATWCGLPLFERLKIVIDPEWLTLLRVRNPYLFPTLWPPEILTFLTLQLLTIIIAASLVASRVRAIFLAVVGVSLGSFLLATIFGDLWPLLLVVQAQLWRAAWLVAALGAISLAICLFSLPQKGSRLELSCIFLVAGWLFAEEPSVGFACAAIAFCLFLWRSRSFVLSRTSLNIVWSLVICVGIVSRLPATFAYVHYVMETPVGGHAAFSLFLALQILEIPFTALAVFWTVRQRVAPAWSIGLAGALLVVFLCFVWDDRTAIRKVADRAPYPAELTALLPNDQSEILWIGEPEPWYFIDHPSWALRIQGAGIVFSRPLSMHWQERIRALITLDLSDKNLLSPWTVSMRPDGIQLRRTSVTKLCARSDAPSTIVAPIEDGMEFPADLDFNTWQPLAPQFRITQKQMKVVWHKVKTYIIVSCKDLATAKNL